MVHSQLDFLVVAVPLVDELKVGGENFESVSFFFGIFKVNAMFVLPLFKGATEESVTGAVG